MKLIREYEDSTAAEIISQSLREKGVMTSVTSVDSQRLGRYKTGSLKVGLWVMFDEQYKDAVALLDDPNHQPEFKVSIDDMDQMEKEVKIKQQDAVNKIMSKMAVIVFGGGLTVLAIYIINAMLQ